MRRLIPGALVMATGLFVLLGIETIGFSGSTPRRGFKPNPMSIQEARKYRATKEITVDKQTGQRRLPTAEETLELVDTLAAMTNNSTEGLQETTLPNGVKAIDLQGRFAPVTLARPNADGTMELKCVTGFEEAAEFLGLVKDDGRQQ